MRYTWIDGMYMRIDNCAMCPFYSTEYELCAECKYPLNPAERDAIGCRRYGYLGDDIGVSPDCPLREKEQ